MGAFATQFSKSLDKAYKRVSDTATGATILMFTAIVNDTPVDTGKLRANWVATLDTPNSNVVDSVSTSGDETVNQVQQTVSSGHVNWFVNLLPYAPIIEYGLYPNPSTAKNPRTYNGYSTQSPQGMVSINTMRFRQFLKVAADHV